MYDLKLKNIANANQYEELIKLFLTPQQYRVFTDQDCDVPEGIPVFTFDGDKNSLKRQIYRDLKKVTGKSPRWGILTGIRPVKLTGELYRALGTEEKTKQCLKENYLVEDAKADLLFELYSYQQARLGMPSARSAGIYIGIPFCPTRCLYCSFTSNQVGPEKIKAYLKALYKEIQYVGRSMEENKISAESLYIGGGTPTTLSAYQLEELLAYINDCIDLSHVKEITVEAGRPDTITPDKLDVLRRARVDRISINPQTMHDRTLETIGRSHTVDQTIEAFQMAHEAGISIINADLIAGLPGETVSDFKESLNQVIELDACNITVHTLAVKRSSRLKDMDENFHYKHPIIVEEMLAYAKTALEAEHYRPYYLYKQKHTAGNTENIGYCKNNTLSVYNVRIMEEAQSIIALGAGGITKVYYPEENRLERVPNVSNYEIYIERIDEMLQRKRENLFRR